MSNEENISKKIVSKLNIKDIVKEISSIPNITSEKKINLTNIVIDKILDRLNHAIQELLSSNQNITEEEVILDKIIKSDNGKLVYGQKYDIIKIDEVTNKLVYLCKYYDQINKAVKSKLVSVYKEIKQNDELKNYLKFIYSQSFFNKKNVVL